MSDDMIRRLDLVQSYFVREGLGFDEKCIAIEEARDLIKGLSYRLDTELGQYQRESLRDRKELDALRAQLQEATSRLSSCEKERDKYRAALLADRGEEAANRIRDEDRAFCNVHQVYFDSDIGCAKCNVSERAVEKPSFIAAALGGENQVLKHMTCGAPLRSSRTKNCLLPAGHAGDHQFSTAPE